LNSQQIPDAVRVLNIFGAEYYMPWEDMPPGASVFLPTTATHEQVKPLLRPAAKYLGSRFVVRQRCEFGVFGVRIWRVY
jgi:hypothetical protein